MSETYWQQQHKTPLFSDILWSRPETKQGAGKLLIIGGNSYGFAAPAQAYEAAVAAGIGTMRVLLPISTQKLLSHLEGAVFAPQNPSGSFSRQALDAMLMHAQWADAVLLAGELGRNSETAITLESFVKKYTGLLCVTKDAIEYFFNEPSALLDRDQTLIVGSIEQLQKLAMHIKHNNAVMFGMSASSLAEWLHEFTLLHKAAFIVCHSGQIFISYMGNVVSQRFDNKSNDKIWRVPTAAKASVYWLQNPTKLVESLACSIFDSN